MIRGDPVVKALPSETTDAYQFLSNCSAILLRSQTLTNDIVSSMLPLKGFYGAAHETYEPTQQERIIALRDKFVAMRHRLGDAVVGLYAVNIWHVHALSCHGASYTCPIPQFIRTFYVLSYVTKTGFDRGGIPKTLFLANDARRTNRNCGTRNQYPLSRASLRVNKVWLPID
jgi:hypothetical protein